MLPIGAEDADAMTFNPDSASAPCILQCLVIQEALCSSVSAGFDGRMHSGEIIVSAQLKPGADRKKVLAIIEELHRRLNHEQGGALVENLIKLYGWWRREILLAGEQGEVERLQRVHAQMGEVRQGWEHVLFQGEGMSESPRL